MPVTFDEARELERLGVENVRASLHLARAGDGAFIHGLSDGKILRADVEDWLKERDQAVKERKLHFITEAVWIGVAVVIVGAAIATTLGVR